MIICRGEVGSAYGEQSGSGAHSAKRQLRVLREIAALATTLPLEWESSVHIRVDTCRMDLLKAAIIGPQDTPYRYPACNPIGRYWAISAPVRRPTSLHQGKNTSDLSTRLHRAFASFKFAFEDCFQ